MYEDGLPLQGIILGSISGGIALGTPFSPFLTPTWALLIGCFSGVLVAIWIKTVQPRVAKYSLPLPISCRPFTSHTRLHNTAPCSCNCARRFDSKGVLAFHLLPGLLGSLVRRPHALL